MKAQLSRHGWLWKRLARRSFRAGQLNDPVLGLQRKNVPPLKPRQVVTTRGSHYHADGIKTLEIGSQHGLGMGSTAAGNDEFYSPPLDAHVAAVERRFAELFGRTPRWLAAAPG